MTGHTIRLTRLAALAFAISLLAIACGEDASDPAPAGNNGVDSNNAENNNGGENNTSPNNGDPGNNIQTSEGAIYLSPTDHLVRASMALRGVRPSAEELDAVKADPGELESLVDAYLESEHFGKVIRDMHNETLQLRPFFFWFGPRGDMGDIDLVTFNDSITEAPLRFIEHVIMNDRPYSEIVTADYTYADGLTAAVWGMEYDGDGEEWIETRYPEENRVHSGILTDSRFYMRHYSTPLNAQRSRANAVTRSFLCYDFLDRDINVDGNVDLGDPEAIKSAVKSKECASCHQSLDPIASLFWRHEFFVAPNSIASYPFSFYNPGNERNFRRYFTDRDPGYFGKPVEDLSDLGEAIAEDPRFTACTARRFYSYFSQVDLEDVHINQVATYQKAFIESGMNAKALAKAIVLSDAFRAIGHQDTEVTDEMVGLVRIRPRQMGDMMHDLTGFRWTLNFDMPLAFLHPTAPLGEIDLLSDSVFGYEVIMGGIDDFVVTNPVHTTNPTSSLVYENYALEAAGYIVKRDLRTDAPIDGRVLSISDDERGEEAVRAQLAELHKRFFAEFVEPDSAEIDQSYALFEGALAISDNTGRAWQTVLTAMLQDSRIVYF